MFIKEEYGVLFVVRTESLYIMHINFSFQNLGYTFFGKGIQTAKYPNFIYPCNMDRLY
jgi:hypothetical protein